MSSQFSTPAVCDAMNISSISKKLTPTDLDNLIKQSAIAEVDRKSHTKSSKLSKMANVGALCPDTFDPNDTILCKLAKGKANGGIGPGGKIGNPLSLTVIDDAKMPYFGVSNGPNGVLTDCQDTYGENRINLFYKSKECTAQLLNDFISFRNAHCDQIFAMFVKKLQAHKDADYTIDITKKGDLCLDIKFHEDFNNLCSLFTTLLEKNKKGISLKDMGLNLISYCQTWLRGDTIGDAQFSVMSPHFQTRIYVVDDKKFMEAIDNNQDFAKSYVNAINHFTNLSQANYGGSEGPSFIDLDYLYKTMH